MDRKYELIVAIVTRGYSDFVIDAARDAGATGGTILHGRGTNDLKKEKFLGINLQPERDMVLILVDIDRKLPIMQTICERMELEKQGRGLCFSLPVNDVMGMSYLTAFTRQEVVSQDKVDKGVINTVEEKRKKDSIKHKKSDEKAKKEEEKVATTDKADKTTIQPKPSDKKILKKKSLKNSN